jgi:adenosine deaminase
LTGPDGLTRDALGRLPKAELHTHLDGCLRPATLLELAGASGVALAASTPGGVADAMLVRHARNLEEYLQRYLVTGQVLQSRDALIRVARELAEDAAADGIRYLEARFCPALHAPGVTLEEALEAVLEGLAAGETSTGIRTRVIACGLRTLPPDTSLRIARAAVTYRDAGVAAFDLAGAEAGYPPEAHATAFRAARDGGLRITCHAGEAAGADYVRAAWETCGAERIGHGVRLRDDGALLRTFADRAVPLEVCLTSNVHTRAVARLEHHPVTAYLGAGVPITLNTDSRLMDRTTLTDEYWLAHTRLDLDAGALRRIALAGFEHAFLPAGQRRALLAEVTPAIEAWP